MRNETGQAALFGGGSLLSLLSLSACIEGNRNVREK